MSSSVVPSERSTCGDGGGGGQWKRRPTGLTMIPILTLTFTLTLRLALARNLIPTTTLTQPPTVTPDGRTHLEGVEEDVVEHVGVDAIGDVNVAHLLQRVVVGVVELGEVGGVERVRDEALPEVGAELEVERRLQTTKRARGAARGGARVGEDGGWARG